MRGLRVLVLGAVAMGMAAPQAAGPIGYWKLDETAGPAGDSINSADGAWSGGVAASTDVPPPITTAGAIQDCGSLRFSTGGAVNYVTLGRNAALDASQNGSFTLSAWFKPASVPPAAGSDTQYGIVLKTGLHEGLSMAGNSFVMGHWVGSTPTYVSAGYGAPTAQVGAWHHVAGVVDTAAMRVRVYINGNPPPFNAEGTIPAATPTAWPGYSNAPWLIGINDPAGGGARYQADGWVDDVRVYDRVLTTTEITTLANGGIVGDPPVTPPAAPTGVTATPGTDQVTLSWTPVAGASGYNVKRSTSPGGETNYAIATSSPYTDTGAVGGTQYYYVVSTLAGCSESSNSAEVSAMPTSPVPPPPRTAKVGGEENPCGCGTVDLALSPIALALLLLVLAGR